MENGERESKRKALDHLLEVEAVSRFPFFIFHSSFLTLGAFVSSWQKQRKK